MKKIINALGSLKISIFLFLVFACFCALATFIESAYSTPTAWAMVYGTGYFALIQLLLGLNLACGILRYKMLSLKKLPLFIFHLSFLFILFGAAMTRYTGFEGLLHIREQSANSSIESARSYIKFFTLKDNVAYGKALPEYIGLLPFANDFSIELDLNGEKALLKYKNLLLAAEEKFTEDQSSPPLLSIMINSQKEGVSELLFKEGEIKHIAGVNFSFLNDEVKAPFVKIDENLNLSSSENLNFLSMSSGESSNLKAFTKTDTMKKRLYSYEDLSFVIKFASMNAKIELVGKNPPEYESFFKWLKSLVFGLKEELSLDKNALNALELSLSYKGETKDLAVLEFDRARAVELGGQKFFVSYTTVTEELPFELYLKNFILERYPGSMSPSSYASDVKLIDEDLSFDYRIFMNNVLDYKGYRFYQSSYDEDEKGTVLSVNKDPGKIPTYIGYFLLCFGMFLSLLNPHSRFRTLARLVNEDALKIILVFLVFAGLSQNLQAADINASKAAPLLSKEHSLKLATLVVQKSGGRMAPLDTLAGEILGKVYKDTSYKGSEASAVVLSMFIFKAWWAYEPMIIMPTNKAVNEEFSKILGLSAPQKYLRYVDFFDQADNYKLQKYVENANRKNPNSRGIFDKEIIKLDERANIINLALNGDLLKIFPLQSGENDLWLSPNRINELQGAEKEQVSILLSNYINTSILALVENNYTKADLALELIKEYQRQFGAKIIPSETKLNTELFVNKAEIFVKLSPVYLLAGLLLLCLVLFKMLSPNTSINLAFKIVYILNIFAFLVHTVGLCLRAYLADHAPWSNAYESMIYIAFALGLSGIFFSRKSPLSLSLTSILAGLVLWVAHLGELDPQITNLVPVLNSYWLSIHVSVITASYGFLGLCALLGIFVLVLLCFMKKKGSHNTSIARNITEATRINEMAMILGLMLLTVGNFLGAIWANESWGRYWSWDSKEVWALVSILIYAAVLHIRLVPSLRSQYNFALASMFAYWSIIMTYFGVNYFLVGMHSYAAGDATKIPDYVYLGFILMLILAIISFFKRGYAKSL